jgi:hypothetical protein
LDLPKSVRNNIYRLSLVYEDDIDVPGFQALCGIKTINYYPRGIPPLLQTNKRVEREAAQIFFGENTFSLAKPYGIRLLKAMVWPRHSKLIRKVSLNGWCHPEILGSNHSASFRMLGTLKSLETLIMRVNEQEMLEKFLIDHSTAIKWHRGLGLSPQLHLQVLNFCGVSGLLSLRDVPRIDFLPLISDATATNNHRGDNVGGFLEATVRRQIEAGRWSTVRHPASTPYFGRMPTDNPTDTSAREHSPS